ncbi:MAG: hypothetical protein GY953_15025 [bacterium]|nr:hypothetical protein [bacterium]
MRNQLDEARQQSGQLSQDLDTANSRLFDLERTLQTIQSQAARALASFILLPGLERSGGETAVVSIPSGGNLVELKLDLGLDEYQSYQAALYDSGGAELITRKQLRAVPAAETVHVVIQFPARILPPDDYQIRLSGLTAGGQSEMIDSYPFRVLRP